MSIPILGDVIDAVKDIIGEVVVDKDKRNEINLEITKIGDAAEQRLHEQMIAQAEINKVEAASGSLFVAGWRPFVGWVSGVGLATQAIVLPVIAQFTGVTVDIDTQLLVLTLGGMLGIGGMRTYEKVKGVSTNDYSDVPSRQPEAPKPKKKILGISLPEKAPWA